MKTLIVIVTLMLSCTSRADSRFEMLNAVNIKMMRIQTLSDQTEANAQALVNQGKELGEQEAEELVLRGQDEGQSPAQIRESIILNIQGIEDEIDSSYASAAAEILSQSKILGHVELLEYVENELEGAQFLPNGESEE